LNFPTFDNKVFGQKPQEAQKAITCTLKEKQVPAPQIPHILNDQSMRLLILLALTLSQVAYTQDTFSIVAVDSITGQVGSAGASCLDNNGFPGSNGAIIISDVLPGRGAIHTQAQWNSSNQLKARQRMQAGDSPQQIIDFIKANGNDANFNSSIRQYGIADLSATGSPRSAGFTGANCFDYKNHITGPNYSIQGNILSGQAILDSMEARFLNTNGSLAEKLMAALQGANTPGADTRCLSNGTSSLSAFIRVANPSDTNPQNFYLNLNVPSLPTGMEPIDSLQKLFTQWQVISSTKESAFSKKLSVYPNPSRGSFHIKGVEGPMQVQVYQSTMQLVKTIEQVNPDETIDLSNQPTGVYFLHCTKQDQLAVLRVELVN
jgi:uncharacterized Ntn-hydrolase superfamily protein